MSCYTRFSLRWRSGKLTRGALALAHRAGGTGGAQAFLPGGAARAVPGARSREEKEKEEGKKKEERKKWLYPIFHLYLYLSFYLLRSA